MAKRNLTLFIPCLEYFDLNKDPFLVPYYLGRMLDCEVNILTMRRECNKNLQKEYQGVNILFFNESTKDTNDSFLYSKILDYVRKNAKKIDILVLFFWDDNTRIFLKTYKRGNSLGKVYIKMDINPFNIKDWPGVEKFSLVKRMALWILRSFRQIENVKNIDLISCETSSAYNIISNSKIPEFRFGKKLILIPNGLNEQEICKMNIKKIPFKQKENIFLTVGRLGSPPKNTPMILRALEKVDLKNWQFYMVGGVEDEFEITKKKFMMNHPELEDKVIWTGPIKNRKELFELYNKSKVFVLSSLWESYGFVLIEAQRYSNYIISTPVGASYDVIEGGKYGELVPLDDSEALANVMQSIIDEKTDIDVYDHFDVNQLSWERRLKEVVERLK